MKLVSNPPAGWEYRAVESVCERVTSGGTPSRRNGEFYGGQVPWVKTKELKDGIVHQTEEGITPEAIASSSAKLLPSQTVLMAMYGATVGKLGILASDMTCNQACCAMVVSPSEADHRFLFYSLLTLRDDIVGLATGAAQQNLSGRLIKSLELPFPSIAEQREIGSILSEIDRKIELNRQTARTLEELAQRLFKSWFVDFDPVHAKMAGRQPAHTPPEIADLFPDRLVDSSLGPIPEGWEIVDFSEEFKFTMGQSPPGSTYNETGEGTAFFQGKADFGEFFPSNRIFCTQPTRWADSQDVLFSVRAPVGAMNLALDDCAIGRGLCAIRHHLRSPGVTWFWVKEIADHIESLSGEGALFKSLSKKQLTSVPVIRKPGSLITSVAPIFDDFINKLRQLELETRTLTEIRDRLLPKLISGEIRVPDESFSRNSDCG